MPARTSQGIISIRSIPDDQEIQRIASGPILGTYLYFSPDDRFLLGLGEGYTLRVWRVADGQPALRDELRGCRAHAFSPDGRQLAVGQQEWVLCFDLATGQEVKRWHLPAPAHTLAFHPDNRKLAVGYFNPSVASVYDAASGALLADLPVGAMSNQVVAWHPGRGAPGRRRFRPAHSDLERGREAQGGDPGGPRAACHGADVSPGRRPAGLPLLGRHAAALGPVRRDGRCCSCPSRSVPSAIQPRRPVAGGRAGTASRPNCWK